MEIELDNEALFKGTDAQLITKKPFYLKTEGFLLNFLINLKHFKL
jgi:hypothetical protein